MVDLIGELYVVEKGAIAPDERAILRSEISREIISRIQRWLWANLKTELPSSELGKAMAYLSRYWEGLIVFLEDVDIPLDNNLSERSLRGPVVGRKNYYGNHFERSAETSAILLSVIESCKLSKVDPRDYLQYAVRELALKRRPTLPHLRSY